MKTRKELMKEFLEAKAKSATPAVDPAEGQKSDKQLVAKFFDAIAKQDKSALRALQSDIEAEYKALADGQNVTNDADGGYLVPVEVRGQIIERLKYISPIRQYATVLNLGAKTKINLADGKPVAYWVGEGEEIDRSKVTFGQKTLELNKVAGLGGLTYESLADTVSTPDLQTYVVNAFADAIAEKELDAFVNGDGDEKPYGIRSGDVTPKSVTATDVDYSSLVKLKFSVAKPYRANGAFLMSSRNVGALVGMKDTTGRPIFTAGITEDEGDVLLGRPIIEAEEVPDNEVWFVHMPDYIIGEGGAIRVDFGTTGDDFETDKISVRVIHRVAGRPTIADGFAKLTLTGVSA